MKRNEMERERVLTGQWVIRNDETEMGQERASGTKHAFRRCGSPG
jgi:hypothetical protein